MTKQLKTASGVVSALPSAIKSIEPTIRNAISEARDEGMLDQSQINEVESLLNAALLLKIDQGTTDSLAKFTETANTIAPILAKIITKG
jgi:predicted  nucleic acid-binding Zn-ribbon protein